MKHKGYKTLPFYLQSEIIHDFTMEFCSKYIDYKSRTKDQMEQAARSGKQNIAEGYGQQKDSSKIMLLKVSRGSLEELLVDYQDFLRQKGLPLWEKDDPRAKEVRSLVYKIKKDYNDNNYKSYNGYKIYNNYDIYKSYLDNPEDAANAMICLINQTNMMLNRKITWLEENAAKERPVSPREKWLDAQMKKEREKEKELDQYLQKVIEENKKKKEG